MDADLRNVDPFSFFLSGRKFWDIFYFVTRMLYSWTPQGTRYIRKGSLQEVKNCESCIFYDPFVHGCNWGDFSPGESLPNKLVYGKGYMLFALHKVCKNLESFDFLRWCQGIVQNLNSLYRRILLIDTVIIIRYTITKLFFRFANSTSNKTQVREYKKQLGLSAITSKYFSSNYKVFKYNTYNTDRAILRTIRSAI